MEFSIYIPKSKNNFTFQIVAFGVSIVILFLLFPSINKSFFLIPTLFFIIYLVSKTKKNQSKGKIYLNIHQIGVQTEEDEFQINLFDIDKLGLVYSGYQGKILRGDFIGPFNSFSGIDNFIHIVKDSYEFKCNFLVENANEEDRLFELIRNWKLLGYDTSNIRINK